ncbi:hypothetical protein [Chryseobacterium salivictor]|uniref:Uncharacterized protein n=1 Tax=Chryseobacterium salivictor TaxID=2547600 RepID=A0A4P6ZFR6_9FLAO|nr:hypothetical protein [Chryseobacterium salivictor]QBO58375.1 hypothetical protein NBC122_01560 [Chryseobacterium salivictor]
MMYFDSSQRISAFSGMALIVLMQIESGEVLKTIVLAGLGGVSSYLFTLAVKFLLIRFRKKFK